MNNSDAQTNIDLCVVELDRIENIIQTMLGHTSPIVPYLTRYSIVKACGTIELCFKTIIADLHSGTSPQVMNYIDNTIRSSSMNPSISNICSTLKKFDSAWNTSFKEKIRDHSDSERIKDSLDSLNNARNSFAHGGVPTSSFENIKNYFTDTIEILKILDEVVNE